MNIMNHSFNKIIVIIVLIINTASLISCKKFLDAKSDQKLAFPTTIKDLQALIDEQSTNNERGPSTGEASSDNYYLTLNWFQLIGEEMQRIYTWEKDYLFKPGLGNDWANAYVNIYKANTVLDNIDKIQRTGNDQIEISDVTGQALFIRAKSFQDVAFLFALSYDPITANSDLGIPLRLDPNFNKPSVRSTLKQTYDQIISDFKKAILLLPSTSLHKVRPSKPAAYAFLARTYLSMKEYDSCLKYSDLCLQIKNDLLNFENDPEITPSNTYTIERFNKEVLLDGFASSNTSIMLSPSLAKIDSTLYDSYDDNDMRKTIFFKENTGSDIGTFRFRGGYMKGGSVFTGIAVDEVYLMRAECYARKGNVSAAINDLNTLMEKRWNSSTWIPFTAANATDALIKILSERRKELVMRNLRWMDLKRLNKEGANITLKRAVDGNTYTLPPNDLRYALAIPEDVIFMSGMPQNER